MDDDCSVSYARIADRYEQARGGDRRAAQLAAALVPWLRGSLVLDVGAGTGIVTDHVRRAGYHVLACDVAVEMVRRAGSRIPGRVVVADAAGLPVRDRSVDTVVFVWVLHHVGDLGAAMREARRVLRGRGRVVAISGLSDPAGDDMAPIVEAMTDELRPDRRERHIQAVTAAGATAGLAVTNRTVATTTADISPNDLVAAIEDRLYSHLWDLPASRWNRVVQPAIEALHALDQPDRVRQRVFDHPLVVLEPDR